jgi:site-specific recombinase XerD
VATVKYLDTTIANAVEDVSASESSSDALHKAGISNFTFHDLRHMFASQLVMSGVAFPTGKELLGHKAIAMTIRYTHLTTDPKQRTVTALERFGEKSQQNSQQNQPREAGSGS